MTALDRQSAVVAAFHGALAADPALAALVGTRIYRAPPGRAELPCIVVRAVTASDASTADTDAERLVLDIDVWDRPPPESPPQAIAAAMGHIRHILHMRYIESASMSLVSVRCTATRGPRREDDGSAVRAVMTFTVLAGHDTALS